MPRNKDTGTMMDLLAGESLLDLQKRWGRSNFEQGIQQTYRGQMKMHTAYKLTAIARRFKDRFEEVDFLTTTVLHELSSPRISDADLDFLLEEMKAGRVSTLSNDVKYLTQTMFQHQWSAKETVAFMQGNGSKPAPTLPVTPPEVEAPPVETPPKHMSPEIWSDLKELAKAPALSKPASSFTYDDEKRMAEMVTQAGEIKRILADLDTLEEWVATLRRQFVQSLDDFSNTYRGEPQHDNHR